MHPAGVRNAVAEPRCRYCSVRNATTMEMTSELRPPDGRPPLDTEATEGTNSADTQHEPSTEKSLFDMAAELRVQLRRDQKRRSERLHQK